VFSCDEGETFTPVVSAARGKAVHAILALDRPGELLVQYGMDLFVSKDAGCSYTKVEMRPDQSWTHLLKGAGGVVYGYKWGQGALLRWHHDHLSWLNRPSGEGMRGLGADMARPGHVRAADDRGQFWDSVDYGTSWKAEGPPAIDPERAELRIDSVVFDAANLDRAVILTHRYAIVTRDGARTWKRVRVTGDDVLREVAFSPTEGPVVWAISTTSLLRSTNLGESFNVVLRLDLHERSLDGLKAHPADIHRVYFEGWTTRNTLYRFDYKSKRYETSPMTSWGAFEPSPATPKFWYVGLTGPPRPRT
jgi:hypothetical protein